MPSSSASDQLAKSAHGTALRPPPDLTGLLPAERPIIARALANKPQDRWPSCTEWMTALNQATRR